MSRLQTGKVAVGAGKAAGLTAIAFDGDPPEWLPRLQTLLTEQFDLCEKLDGLSAAQTIAVDRGDSDVLMRILGERQVLVDKVSAINSELESFRRVRDRALAKLGEMDRSKVNRQIERIAALVDGVCARDEKDRATLEAQRRLVSDELVGVNRAQGAVRAYGAGAGAPSPRFQDRRV